MTCSPATSQARDPRGDARAGEDAGERGDEQPRVDRVVAVDAQREPDRRRQRGLDLARLRRAQALDRQPELGAEGGEPVQRLGLVAVAGDDQRARRAIARLLELVAERRVAARALQAQLQQRPLAELGLGDRGEHARGDVPRAGLAGVDHDHPRAALRSAPRAGEPDRATTDDGDVEAL